LSKILIEIPPQGFEIIRDRIGEILADELVKQFTLHADPERNPDVHIERLGAFDKTELPAANVLYARSDFGGNTAIDSDGKNQYHVDVYTNAKATAGERGDSKSMQRVSRILGIFRAILESPHYLTLGFAAPPGFIMRTKVLSIEIQDPKDNPDSKNTSMGRLTIQVDAVETVEQIQPRDAEGYDTQVKLEETDKGFVYVIDNP